MTNFEQWSDQWVKDWNILIIDREKYLESITGYINESNCKSYKDFTALISTIDIRELGIKGIGLPIKNDCLETNTVLMVKEVEDAGRPNEDLMNDHLVIPLINATDGMNSTLVMFIGGRIKLNNVIPGSKLHLKAGTKLIQGVLCPRPCDYEWIYGDVDDLKKEFYLMGNITRSRRGGKKFNRDELAPSFIEWDDRRRKDLILTKLEGAIKGTNLSKPDTPVQDSPTAKRATDIEQVDVTKESGFNAKASLNKLKKKEQGESRGRGRGGRRGGRDRTGGGNEYIVRDMKDFTAFLPGITD